MAQRKSIRSAHSDSRPWLPGSSRAGRWCLLLGLICGGLHAARGADEPVAKEYQIKAAYLYNFTKFVDWPEQCFRDGQSPIIIGVLGRNPFGDELGKIVRDRLVNGRAIQIRFITMADEIRTVHVLYVPAGEENRPELAMVIAEHLPLLTAGESEPFLARGGIIIFTKAGDKLRFTINLDSADRAGLRLSAQLLKLATVVRRPP